MPIHDKTIEKIASQMYEPKLPYHNFGHAVTVTRHSEAIIERCKKENAPLDETVVYYALIGTSRYTALCRISYRAGLSLLDTDDNLLSGYV